MVLHLYRSNRMERLVDALAAVVGHPLPSVLSPELIAVPSPGMERWLSMELAERLGVWANPAFPFPRALIDQLLDGVLADEQGDREAYEPLRMQFAIAALLAPLLEAPELSAVRRYVGDAADASARRLALAARIAEVFDHYVTYRPELVRGWQEGRESHWQALLFRALVARAGDRHLASRAAAALRVLSRGDRGELRLPPRIHVFGVSTLPPL